jgi:quercetin dioxygenase-like cupin family protein
MRRLFAGIIVVTAVSVVAVAGRIAAEGQSATPKTFMSPGGTQLRVLVDAASLGGTEVEMAELTFAANSDSGDHRHAVTETFYVLEGELEQVINDKPVKLGPGMVASIRATDTVRHKSGPNGAKVLVVWAPGGEIARVTARWKPQ